MISKSKETEINLMHLRTRLIPKYFFLSRLATRTKAQKKNNLDPKNYRHHGPPRLKYNFFTKSSSPKGVPLYYSKPNQTIPF